jgi:hypothetical protein
MISEELRGSGVSKFRWRCAWSLGNAGALSPLGAEHPVSKLVVFRSNDGVTCIIRCDSLVGDDPPSRMYLDVPARRGRTEAGDRHCGFLDRLGLERVAGMYVDYNASNKTCR